jgi:hypothetical protein
MAANKAIPGPVRVHAHAMANRRNNRHIEIRPGDLETLLGAPAKTVRNWRNRAVEMGLLAEGTWAKCLILPAGSIAHAARSEHFYGSMWAECRTCKDRYRPTPAAADPWDGLPEDDPWE